MEGVLPFCSMARILIVEDEAEMAKLLAQALSESGFVCAYVSDGRQGLAKVSNYDLALVDIMMPIMSGLEMVSKMRAQGIRTPVIFLTARDSTQDIVKGLDTGADDYLVKPFKLEELLARIRAAVRRSRETENAIAWSDLRIDCAKRTAYRGNAQLFLSSTEFVLLELFLRRPEVVLSKSSILAEVWQDEGYRDENIVEVYINYLRKKTELHGSRLIQTVRGRGYVLALAEPHA